MSKRARKMEGMSGILKDLNITLPFSTENSTYKGHVKLEKPQGVCIENGEVRYES